MEVKHLSAFVLMIVITGMILGVGVLVMNSFSTGIMDSESVINETIAMTSQTGQTANTNVTSLTFFGNGNETFTIPTDVNVSYPGIITGNSTIADGDYNASYSYKQSTRSSVTIDNVVDSLAPIATTWFGLIITISILGIILTLVIRSFVGKDR